MLFGKLPAVASFVRLTPREGWRPDELAKVVGSEVVDRICALLQETLKIVQPMIDEMRAAGAAPDASSGAHLPSTYIQDRKFRPKSPSILVSRYGTTRLHCRSQRTSWDLGPELVGDLCTRFVENQAKWLDLLAAITETQLPEGSS